MSMRTAILHQRRSEYGREHRHEYELQRSRKWGGRSSMVEYIPVVDKSNTLTTVTKDNMGVVYETV